FGSMVTSPGGLPPWCATDCRHGRPGLASGRSVSWPQAASLVVPPGRQARPLVATVPATPPPRWGYPAPSAPTRPFGPGGLCRTARGSTDEAHTVGANPRQDAAFSDPDGPGCPGA